MSSRELIRPDKLTASPLSALVVANCDHEVLMTRVLESHGFKVTRSVTAAYAKELCKRQRFDLAIYDHDVNGALELAGARHPSSQPRVAVGLYSVTRMHQVSGARLHFVVHKPFSADLFAKTVKAAYGPIAADRRTSFRHQVDVTASCSVLDRSELRKLAGARIVNLSRTGLCLQASEMLPQTAEVELSFPLPSSQVTVRLAGVVIWAHASGRAGIKFTLLDPEEQRKLEDWLDSLLPGADTMLTPRLPNQKA
jgi:hypothetical protein